MLAHGGWSPRRTCRGARGGVAIRRSLNYVGLLIGVLGVVFVTREIVRQRAEVASILAAADTRIVWLAFPVALLSMTAIGLGWRRCIMLLGEHPRVVPSLHQYFVGQLGKYVPGGIWPVVGRAEMARRGGVAAATAYGSTMLSLFFTYLAAVVLVSASAAAGTGLAVELRLALMMVVPVGLVALHPRVLELVLTTLRRLSGKRLELVIPPWGRSVTLMLAHVPAWLGISTATWILAVSLGPISLADLPNLVFATTLSWAVGFAAVGVPGGIGVREAVFVATATSMASSAEAATVAVAARLLFVVVDLAGAGLLTATERRDRQVRRRRDR